MALVEVNISGCAISDNDIGVQNSGGTTTIRLSNSDISFNTTALSGHHAILHQQTASMGNGSLGAVHLQPDRAAVATPPEANGGAQARCAPLLGSGPARRIRMTLSPQPLLHKVRTGGANRACGSRRICCA
jgi:hypothetical protein